MHRFPRKKYESIKIYAPLECAIIIFICTIAIGTPAIIDDITSVHLPIFGGIMPPISPWWGICLILIITIYGINLGSDRFILSFQRSDAIAAALIITLSAIDIYFYYRNGPLNISFPWSIFWMYLIYISARISYSEKNYGTILIAFPVITGIIIFFGSILSIENALHYSIYEYFKIRSRPDWSFNNSISYCAAMAAIICTLNLMNSAKINLKIIFLTSFILNITGIALNKSRGAWISLIIGISLVAIHELTKRYPKFSIYLLPAMASFVLVITYIYWAHVEALISLGRGLSPQSELSMRDGLSPSETSASLRHSMAKHAFDLFQESPLYGHGQAMLGTATIGGYGMHGIPLIIIAGYGLAGTAPFLALLHAFLPRHPWRGSWLATIAILAPLITGMLLMSSVHLWYAIPLLLLYQASLAPTPQKSALP